MGAASYGYFIEGADLNRAFGDLVDGLRAERGNNPYTGTPASSYGGAEQVTTQVCTRSEAERLGSDLLHGLSYNESQSAVSREAWATTILDALGGTDHVKLDSQRYRDLTLYEQLPSFMRDKNGTAGAIPVGFDDELPVKQRGVPVDLVSLGLTNTWPDQKPIRDAIGKAVKSARISHVEVLTDEPKWRFATKRTEGKVVTKYEIYEVVNDRGEMRRYPGHKAYPTLPAAREAADTICRNLTTPPGEDAPSPLTLEVLGRTRREDGSALVRAQRILGSRFVVYKVSLVKPKTTTPRIRGWYVFGMAGT